MCAVSKDVANKLIAAGLHDLNTFTLDQLQMKNLPYLKQVFLNPISRVGIYLTQSFQLVCSCFQSDALKYIYLYCHRSSNSKKALFGLFIPTNHKASIFVKDTVATNQMPSMSTMYANERNAKYVLKLPHLLVHLFEPFD